MRDGSDTGSRIEVAETYEVMLGGRSAEVLTSKGARRPAVVPVLLCDHAGNALPSDAQVVGAVRGRGRDGGGDRRRGLHAAHSPNGTTFTPISTR